MKKIALLIITTAFLLSCKSEKEEWAQKAIDRYVIFMDSVNKADADKRVQRWDFIAREHTRKRQEALQALQALPAGKKEKQQKRVYERDEKYKGIAATISNK